MFLTVHIPTPQISLRLFLSCIPNFIFGIHWYLTIFDRRTSIMLLDESAT